METLYFAGFCFGIAGIIFWGLKHDDQDEFSGQRRDKKFRPSKKTETELPANKK